jgi:hypothetical protein
VNSDETDLYLDRNKPTYVGGVLESAITRTYMVWSSLTAACGRGSRRATRAWSATPLPPPLAAAPYRASGLILCPETVLDAHNLF